jgi:hypothetical protein
MLKIFACLFMLLDHIGAVFFPGISAFRIIGRLAMPIFALGLATGFFWTKKKGTTAKYFLRMFLFALISQIPFMLMNIACGYTSFTLNIGFTWLFALAVLYMLDNFKGNELIYSFGIVAIIYITGTVKMDYGLYGVALPVLLYYTNIINKKKVLGFFSVCAITILKVIKDGWLVQIYAPLGIVFAEIIETLPFKIKVNKWFFYVFYPLHMLILWALHHLI